MVSTVVLKIQLDCDGCIKRIEKGIRKIKGAFLKNIFHPNSPFSTLEISLMGFGYYFDGWAGVQVVTLDAQKDLVTVKGTMDAKALPEVLKEKLKREVEVALPKKNEGGEKKDKGGDKKEKGEGGGGGGKEAATNLMEYYAGYPYYVEMVYAPQLFSDDNPNACSVM